MPGPVAGAHAVARSLVLGAGLTVLAVIAKLAVERGTGVDAAYLLLFAVAPIAVLKGGAIAGSMVVLLGALVDAVLFHDPVGVLGVIDGSAAVRLLIFVPVGLWIVWLNASLVQNRRAAARAARRQRRVLDGLPDIAIVVDPETWRIAYVNESTIAHGWSSKQLVGADVEALIPGLRAAVGVDEAPVAIGLRGGDGQEIPVQVLARSLESDDAGSPILIVAHEMTDRIDAEVRLTRLAASERAQAGMLTAVISSMDAGVALLASDGRVLMANDALTAIIGGPVQTEGQLGAALGGALADGDVEVGDPPRQVRVAIRELGDELDRLRLVQVRDMADEVQAAAARDAFLGVLSHELRTPVTTILGISHVLRRSGDLSGRQAISLLDDVADEAERLNYLIEDLLVLSRAQVGAVAYEAEPVLVQHAIREVVDAESRRSPHVSFEVEAPSSLPPVNGDRTFVTQVLRNLIGNAAKYGPRADANVRVVASRDGGKVLVQVQDEGPGFPPEDEARIFDIFYRAAGTAKQRAGSGIGLFVTRTLVRAMGGEVWATLRPTIGAEFSFTLPISEADEADGA